MLLDYTLGQTSVILRFKIRNSSVATGAGLTGLTGASSGLIISTIADNEATATVYTAAASHIGTIAALGTFATPAASSCRFAEVDATNHKGIYELQLDNTRFAVSSAKSLLISVSGAANAAECDVLIPLRTVNPYLSSYGLSLAKSTNITGFNDIAATAIVSGGAINTSSGAVTTVTTTTNLTNLPSIPTNWITAAGINAAALNGKGDWLTAAGTLAHVTLVDTVTTYTGNTPQTGDAFARIGATGSGLTSLAPSATALSNAQWTNGRAAAIDNLDAAVSSRSTYSGGAVASVTAGVNLASTGLDSVVVETGLNGRQTLSIIAAALAGNSSGVDTGSPAYKGAGVSTTRISGTASNGNRSSIILSPPA